MKIRWLLLCVAVCMLGCSGDAVPVGPTEAVAPEVVAESYGTVHASNGQSGCYTVKFNVSGHVETTSGAPISPWQVSGDIVGEQTWFPDFTTFRFTGVIFRVSGEMDWSIDGGVVPGLGEFKTSFDLKNVNMDRPGSPDGISENIGKHRALEGVQKANLTFKGVTNVGQGYSSMDYQGVICP